MTVNTSVAGLASTSLIDMPVTLVARGVLGDGQGAADRVDRRVVDGGDALAERDRRAGIAGRATGRAGQIDRRAVGDRRARAVDQVDDEVGRRAVEVERGVEADGGAGADQLGRCGRVAAPMCTQVVPLKYCHEPLALVLPPTTAMPANVLATEPVGLPPVCCWSSRVREARREQGRHRLAARSACPRGLSPRFGWRRPRSARR